MSLSCNLCTIFLMIRLRKCILGRNTKLPFQSLGMKSTYHQYKCITVDVHLTWGCVCLFHGKFILSCCCFSYCAHWKEVTMHSSHVRSHGCAPPWGRSSYVNYLGFFCMGYLFIQSHLFIQESILIPMTICKFALSFVIIQFCLVYFIVGIIPVLTSRSSFVSCVILKKNPALGVYLFLITFLMALKILQVHPVYFLPSPQSAISLRSPDSFFRECY